MSRFFHLLRSLLALTLFFAGFAAAATGGASQNSLDKTYVRNAPTPAWVEKRPDIPATQRPDPVIIRLADTQVQNGKELSVHYVRAVQVNDQEALSIIGQYAISYVPDYQRLYVHQVAIIRQGQLRDQTATARMQVLQREPQLEAGMMGGLASLQMLLSDVRVGDTLLISYTITGKNPVFGGRWSTAFDWDSGIPAEHRRLIVTHPAEQKLYWAQRGDFKTTAIPSRVETVGKNEKLVFEERAIDAVEYEPGTPSEYLPGRQLEFSEYRDWREVAQWGDKLFPAQPPTAELKALIRKFAQEATPEKRAAAALHWVQNEIRYFSVSLGENSHKPRIPSVVLNTRFGDCKDKSYLLVALLAGLDIKAEPVLVSATAPRFAARALPSPLNFDHVIVQAHVNGRTYYIDPTRTGQTEALEQLPVAVPTAAGLVVDAATEKLLMLPDDTHQLPQFEIAERFELPSLDGEGKLEARRTYRGNYAAGMRRMFSGMSASTMSKHALGLYEKSYPGLTLAAPPSVIEEDGNAVLVTRFVIPHPLTLSDDRYGLAITNKVLEGIIDLPDKIVRNYPYAPDAGKFRGRHTVHVVWPERSRVNDEVAAKTMDNRFFSYHREYALRGNTLHYQMDFATKVDRLEAADMPQWQTEANRLDKIQVGLFSVGNDSLLGTQPQVMRYRDVEGSLSLMAFGRQAVAWTKDAAPENWCLTLVQGYLGADFMPEKRRERFFELRPQELMKPDRKEDVRCVGGLAFMRQDFAGALKYWDTLSLEDGDTLKARLAWARLFRGDSAGAVKDMQRYYDHQVAAGLDNPLELLRYVALLKRAGAAVPEPVKARLAERNSTVWPRPVAAYLAGATDEEALLASAKAQPRDAGEFALAEAWYYIGVTRLMAGDTAGARRAFRYLLANGARSTQEYMLAKAEIEALASKDPDYLAGGDAESNHHYQQALALYEKAVARGDVQAAYAQGLIYYHGNGVPQDKVRAFALLRKAAEGGVMGAQNMLGIYYDDGEGGIARNPQEAEKWYALAVGQYDLHGLRNYGNFLVKKSQRGDPEFERGLGYLQQAAGMGLHSAQADLAGYLSRDKPAVALFWREFAAASGDVEYQFQLASQLRSGDQPLRDDARARRIFAALAKDGHQQAQTELAVMLEYGLGGDKDQAQALALFEKAAKQGSLVAQMRVARFYLYGNVVKEDKAKAAELLRDPADHDVLYASYLLGDLYRSGKGVERDLSKARLYYERAAEGGVVDAQTALGNLFYFGEQGREQALAWYRKASDGGSSVAMNNLGDMYENGVGVPQDYAEAMRLYRQSATMGNGFAFRSIGSMWESGKAGKVSQRQAYLYYLLAAKIDDEPQPDVPAVKQQLGGDDQRAIEAQAEQWKSGDPLPDAKNSAD